MFYDPQYRQKASRALLYMSACAGVSGIILGGVGFHFMNQTDQVGIHIVATGMALLACASMCFYLYVRALCAPQDDIPVARPVAVASVFDNPAIIVVLGVPQAEPPSKISP
jgi:hypothetical protein